MIGALLLASALVTLTGAAPGTNELNPRWSPSGRYLSIERDDGASRTIEIYDTRGAAPAGRLVETLALRPEEGVAGFLLEAAGVRGPTFNAWLAWAPDERRFAFVSNGGEGAYDLYLGDLGAAPAGPGGGGAGRAAPAAGSGAGDGAAAAGRGVPVPLTRDAAADGQVAWSPAGDRLAFVSGRSDRGDLYLLDVATRQVTRLTADGRSVLHPEWSPDGRRIAFAAGHGDNHDICIVDVGRPVAGRLCLTIWPFDDLRPRWSPDGRRLAFYSSYNPDGAPGVWSLFTVAADGSEPAKGEGLLTRRLDTGVVVDLDVGPAWTPDGARLVYAKRVDREFNPVYAVEVASGAARRLETGHAIHHDVAVARDGRLALRAQIARWDRVLVGRLDALLTAGAGAGVAAAAAEGATR